MYEAGRRIYTLGIPGGIWEEYTHLGYPRMEVFHPWDTLGWRSFTPERLKLGITHPERLKLGITHPEV